MKKPIQKLTPAIIFIVVGLFLVYPPAWNLIKPHIWVLVGFYLIARGLLELYGTFSSQPRRK